MGSNMAECHPVGFQWVMEAKRRGATIIHVDPRFTRTSAVADIHVPIRAGSDIVFLGGIVNYICENQRYFREYVLNYTNAAAIIYARLGNMGRPGGGMMALRGHASIQGSTDIPTLYNLLPGYLPMPRAQDDATFDRYVARNTKASGWWSEFPKYAVSLLKAY